MKRFKISVAPHSEPDRYGRQSLTASVAYPDGRTTAQCYNANPTAVVERLRHNIAEQYWFDKKRKRLAS